MTDLKRAIGLAEILHSDLQLSKAEQNEAGVMLRELSEQVEWLTTDRNEWKESTIMANENARREEARRKAVQERKDVLLRQVLEAFESLGGVGQVIQWKNQWEKCHEVCTKIEEELK